MESIIKNMEVVQQQYKITFYYSTTNHSTGDKDFVEVYCTGPSVRFILDGMSSARRNFYLTTTEGITRVINTANVLYFDIEEVPFDENIIPVGVFGDEFFIKNHNRMSKKTLQEQLNIEIHNMLYKVLKNCVGKSEWDQNKIIDEYVKKFVGIEVTEND